MEWREGKSYFHYGKHNLGLQIEAISGVLCTSAMRSTENERKIVRRLENGSGIVEFDGLSGDWQKSKVNLGRRKYSYYEKHQGDGLDE